MAGFKPAASWSQTMRVNLATLHLVICRKCWIRTTPLPSWGSMQTYYNTLSLINISGLEPKSPAPCRYSPWTIYVYFLKNIFGLEPKSSASLAGILLELYVFLRNVRDSNPWPSPWQGDIVTNSTNTPFFAVPTGFEPAPTLIDSEVALTNVGWYPLTFW